MNGSYILFDSHCTVSMASHSYTVPNGIERNEEFSSTGYHFCRSNFSNAWAMLWMRSYDAPCLVFYLMFYRSLFFLSSFFFLVLCCLSFVLWILITPLVSPNSSYCLPMRLVPIDTKVRCTRLINMLSSLLLCFRGLFLSPGILVSDLSDIWLKVAEKSSICDQVYYWVAVIHILLQS